MRHAGHFELYSFFRRAWQYKDLTLRVVPVPLERLAFLVHSDASLKNANQKGTQAGWLLSVCDVGVLAGDEGDWGAIGWKSGRLRRVVQSTLSSPYLHERLRSCQSMIAPGTTTALACDDDFNATITLFPPHSCRIEEVA